MGQGKYGYLTWWEQIDNGTQFTWEKKILTIAPIVLYVPTDITSLLFDSAVLTQLFCLAL